MGSVYLGAAIPRRCDIRRQRRANGHCDSDGPPDGQRVRLVCAAAERGHDNGVRPWFFDNFGAGWRFTPDGDGTRAVWKYTFSCRPALLKPITETVGAWLLGREIERRIEAFARACEDPVLVAEFHAQGSGDPV